MLYYFETYKIQAKTEKLGDTLWSVCREGNTVVSGGGDKTVKLWDLVDPNNNVKIGRHD
jgi:WD40 repeat protein